MKNNIVKKQFSQTMLFPHKDILGIEQLSSEDITHILDLANTYVIQNRRLSHSNLLLKGFVIINLFLENSTRTRLSFEIAAKRLGAEIINFSADGSSIKKGESFIDTLETINAMRPDLLIMRCGQINAANIASELFDCPVINAGDGTKEHPTQALLDALTLRRHFGTLDGLNITICGDIKHSRVAHSNALLLQKMGSNVTLVAPSEFLPQETPHATTSLQEGLKDADAVITLRIQKERLESSLSFTEEEYFKDYGLTIEKMGWAKDHAVVLHPGPMNRNVEIDGTLADDPKRSLITLQVEMGVAVRMACLDFLTRPKR